MFDLLVRPAEISFFYFTDKLTQNNGAKYFQ